MYIRMIGEPRPSLEDVFADLMTKVIHYTIGQLIFRSGHMRLPSAMTARFLSSFVPQAIDIHNAYFQRAQFSFLFNLFFYLYLCIFVSFHYVHNFQKWSNLGLLYLTWFEECGISVTWFCCPSWSFKSCLNH